MGKIPKRTPEEREADELVTRQVQAAIDRLGRRIAADEARAEARRARLQRWTFGLLGREPESDDGVAGGQVAGAGV